MKGMLKTPFIPFIPVKIYPFRQVIGGVFRGYLQSRISECTESTEVNPEYLNRDKGDERDVEIPFIPFIPVKIYPFRYEARSWTKLRNLYPIGYIQRESQQ